MAIWIFKDHSVLDMANRYWRNFLRQLIISITVACTLLPISATSATSSIEGIRVYQNTSQLSEEHKQNIAEDINRYKEADNLWDVLRDEFSLDHYENNPIVQEKIEWFMNNQDFLLRSVNRASPYLHYILQQVRKRHLPAELVLLPIVESGYNPFATSPVGAAGIWQLMPDTASGLGVHQDWWYDGRRDVISSTRAALNYLAYLQSFFDGNWLLAIAAYNTGEGNVLAAIRRNIRDGYDTDFWSLPVAQQTKNYVPSILALAIIISKPYQYPIYFPKVKNAPYLAQVDVHAKINLKSAASLAGLSYNRLLQLNPGFTRAAAKGPYKLVIPIENVEQFSENLVRSPFNNRSSLGWIHYRMKAGDTLLSVARKFKTTPDEIRKLNRLVKTNPRRGTNLLIPDHSDKTISLASAESNNDLINHTSLKKKKNRSKQPAFASNNSSKRLVTEANSSSSYHMQPGDTIYMVRSKDSLESISKKFKVSAKMLMTANNLKGNRVTPGKNLVIPTHNNVKLVASGRVRAVGLNETIYKVRRGDTIAKIAKRFHTSPSSIRIANLVDDNSLSEGINLVIPKPVRA